ncbi:MAG: hypothetical protein A2X18_01820 [Bacteroidetes bacterium GWF2_40_14]|nr:MAG: hypothetical protein A2X18_01820 [Bacteroidetes bacterium GWF2_40_14]
MQKITSTAGLREAITQMSYEHALQGELLKEQFSITLDSLRPVNLIKDTFRDVVESPDLISNVINTSLGLAAGYITNKVFVGSHGGLLKRLLGSIIQMGVTTAIAVNPDMVKSFGIKILQTILSRKEKN